MGTARLSQPGAPRRVDDAVGRATPSWVVACSRHGTSAWCYIQQDGSHIDSDLCRCFLTPNPVCPVDAHRAAAHAAHRALAAGDAPAVPSRSH